MRYCICPQISLVFISLVEIYSCEVNYFIINANIEQLQQMIIYYVSYSVVYKNAVLVRDEMTVLRLSPYAQKVKRCRTKAMYDCAVQLISCRTFSAI